MEQRNIAGAPAPPLRILSLDGGGIRGKSSLLILENILEKYRESKGLDQVPKPCDVFDIIGGTSTGGIIAIMLGRLSMSVDECIRAYDKLAKTAFTPKWNPFPIAPPKGAFSAQALEAAIKQTVKEFCTEESCALQRTHNQSTAETCPHENLQFRNTSCTKTVVLAITKDDVDAPPILFKTYDTSTGLRDCAIWQIARATSAATTFFKSIQLGRDNVEFIDAGFGYNNPCEILINEASQQFPGRPMQILSVGTGLGSVVTISNTRSSILNALSKMATTSSKVAEALEGRYATSDHQYYRFNVDRGLEDVTLSDWEKTSKIAAHTDNYLRRESNKRAIGRFVENLVRGATTVAVAQPGGTPRNNVHFHVPFPKNRRFVGRNEALSKLQKMLFESECQVAALAGLGGIGKTQVALQFAYGVKENHPEYSVFWVPALSDATFEQEYEKIAKELAIEKNPDDDNIKDSVRNHLSSGKAGKWLLIVDNMDDKALLNRVINRYLPRSEHGITLFTTRFREVAQACAENDVIELVGMDSDEALSFVQVSLDQGALVFDEATAKELVHELAYLPLAIKQAVAYLNTAKLPISEYLGRLRSTEKHMTALMSKEFQDNFRYSGSQNAVATTWLVSFDQIRDSGTTAARLLEFISRIEPKAIPESILPVFESEENLASSIDTLCAYAFLTRREDHPDSDHTFDMHRLVHLGTRVWVQRYDLTDQVTTDAIIHLEWVFPSASYESRYLWQAYLPHALKALHESSEYHFLRRYELFEWVGRCLRQDGRYDESIWALKEAYQWAREELPESDDFRLTSERSLASTYSSDGQTKEAIRLLEHVAAVRRGLDEDTDPEFLATQHELARAYLNDGRVEVAIELYERVMSVNSRTLKDTDLGYNTKYLLALAYMDAGRLKDTIELLEDVVEVQKMFPNTHHGRLISEYELARAYLGDGQLDKAIALLEHVVLIREALPEDDRYRLASQHNLAHAYLENGQLDKAIALFEHVVLIREALPEDDRNRLASQHNLARAYQDDGQVDKAIALFEHVISIRGAIPEDNGDRLASQHELARAYLNHRVVTLFEVFPIALEDVHNKPVSKPQLELLFSKDDRIKQAIDSLEHNTAVQKMLPEDSRSRLVSEELLAVAYLCDGQIEKAIGTLEPVVQILKKTREAHDGLRIASENWLKRAYDMLECS
ncbi:hypothetical protein GGR54DRAFT_643255 [Hypoxylon sp. NC1633]|nr:hypothetical protein GGR54DRAFT_643255 [Hypoxylon sp. NC1633]